MTIEDQLDTCRRELRDLDEQEAKLVSLQRNSQQLAEETVGELRWTMKKIGEINDPLQFARKEVGKLEQQFSEAIAYEKRKLSLEREETETTYRKLMNQRGKE
ncbi:hypothetical protein D929_02693 [Enterococcus faecalis 02-MB-P-10]|uniref:hypothetical protein n=1 Tax=Enterococcus faecalis TaxID=1351 RepID=UPI000353E80D|nr:hypothetical protein [Enterococcus faecalis]EPH68900.1 hypothetical protein D929_02693 [Enterococcus faecalis 02-MB-P-10]